MSSMSRHLQLVREHLHGAAIEAAATGVGVAVAVTADELVTGKAGLFGRWGAQVRHYELKQLSGMTVIPSPAASLLKLEFGGSSASTVTILFDAAAHTDCERVVSALQGRLGRPGGVQ